MKKLLVMALAIIISGCTNVQKTAFEKHQKLFTDKSYSRLASGVTANDIAQIEDTLLRAAAQKMLAGEYQSEYRTQEYSAYPTPAALSRDCKLGDGFSRYENMTGIYLPAGEHIICMEGVGRTPIFLMCPELMRQPTSGYKPMEDPQGWGLKFEGYLLSEGVNVVRVEKDANAYIYYFDDEPQSAPAVKVHFLTGKVNGYFDITRGDTNEDWDKLLANAVSPIMDARGKHIQVAYAVDFFKKFTTGKGVELMEAYDAMLNSHYTLMGLVKYNKIPDNRIFARVNFNYYMFRDGDGVAYLGDDNTMYMVASPEVVTVGDPCWGFSHEVGHVLQMSPTTWGGMTEVSNNIFSLYTCRAMGASTSRLHEQNNYESARKSIIEGKISYLQDPDVFNRLVPFWQLQLYFEQNGQPDFYADLMEELRNTAKEYTGNETINYQLDFTKAACDVTKVDLTDFFDKWGFFRVGNIKLEDYASYDFDITQQMVDQTKSYIASKNYPKPKADITLIND